MPADFSASGAQNAGGIFSLMQMAKTAAAQKFSDAGLLYISVLTNPTTGECWPVLRSWGRDIAEPGPNRLCREARHPTDNQTGTASHFQSAEFQLEKGFVDMVVSRGRLREVILRLLRLHEVEKWKRN